MIKLTIIYCIISQLANHELEMPLVREFSRPQGAYTCISRQSMIIFTNHSDDFDYV